MMTTNYNYTSNEYRNKNSSYFIPNNTGRITFRTKHGPYNITEKDFGDHKVVYYIPSSYESNYDLSELDEEPFYKQQLSRYHSPLTVQRQRYHSHDHIDDDNDYIEELPRISPRQHISIPPRRSQIMRRIYYEPSPQTVEYIYEDDYRPKNEETNEYIVRDRVPRQRYIKEIQPIHHPTYVENLPPISRSPAFQLNDIPSPRQSKLKYQTPRITPRKIVLQNTKEQKHLSLKHVLAENRARRGSRIPKPRREVHQEEFHDPPTDNKNFIKNDFFVHK